MSNRTGSLDVTLGQTRANTPTICRFSLVAQDRHSHIEKIERRLLAHPQRHPDAVLVDECPPRGVHFLLPSSLNVAPCITMRICAILSAQSVRRLENQSPGSLTTVEARPEQGVPWQMDSTLKGRPGSDRGRSFHVYRLVEADSGDWCRKCQISLGIASGQTKTSDNTASGRRALGPKIGAGSGHRVRRRRGSGVCSSITFLIMLGRKMRFLH